MLIAGRREPLPLGIQDSESPADPDARSGAASPRRPRGKGKDGYRRDLEELSRRGNRAFYRPATDWVHLPPRDSFKSADTYYATTLHELGHWTGHPSRLDRDLAHPFGSVGYAKEELRAEIASLMIGDQLGIGHDPGQHAAYVKSWVKVLKEDPKEILRASRDADKIAGYVMALEK